MNLLSGEMIHLLYLISKLNWLFRFCHLQDYGAIPEYLQQRNKDARRAQEEYDDYVKEQMKREAMKLLSEEEKQTILKVVHHTAAQWHKDIFLHGSKKVRESTGN